MTVNAKIKTKSNFAGLNGHILKIAEIVGNRVTCNYTDDCNRIISADFSRKEIEFVTQHITKK